MQGNKEKGIDPNKILCFFETGGVLSQALKGFEPREQQRRMTHNIIEAYNHDQIALIEAGTGTGKSLAYLIPAMAWAIRQGEPTVISTHTINLQEQLLFKDIPMVAKALNLNVKAVLVKGMSNYVCMRKLDEAQSEMALLPQNEAQELLKIEAWNHHTKDGTRSTLPLAPSTNTWERIRAEKDTCSHKECPYYQKCYFYKARQQASDAHILIVNHHLLFADLANRAETKNYKDPAILPPYSRIILDEAHHMEDVATEYFASRISRLHFLRDVGRLAAEKSSEGHGKIPILKEKIQYHYKNKDIPSEVTSILTRLNIDLAGLRHDILLKITSAFDSFESFLDHFQIKKEDASQNENKLRLRPIHQTHPHWVQEILPRTEELLKATENYIQTLGSLEKDLKNLKNEILSEQTKNIFFEITALTNRLSIGCQTLKNFLELESLISRVRWIETQRIKGTTNTQIIDAKLNVSEHLAEYLFNKFSTVILCSATLTTNQKFAFMRDRLGLTENLLEEKTVTENIYESPFNFAQQSLFIIPTDIPHPSEENFNQEASELILKAIQASRGNAFVLFTSYSGLKISYEYLEKKLKENRYPILKQGEDSRKNLLHKFKTTDRSVLFGTSSFWEGVDVAGEALRCVIIVKLPFQVPTEPLQQARAEAITAQGGNPFSEYSLPNAIVKFKQGFGRLIRKKQDRGCIVCLDNRLITKKYGKEFLNSLPDCQKVFTPSSEMQDKMKDFYRRTYHLVKT